MVSIIINCIFISSLLLRYRVAHASFNSQLKALYQHFWTHLFWCPNCLKGNWISLTCFGPVSVFPKSVFPVFLIWARCRVLRSHACLSVCVCVCFCFCLKLTLPAWLYYLKYTEDTLLTIVLLCHCSDLTIKLAIFLTHLHFTNSSCPVDIIIKLSFSLSLFNTNLVYIFIYYNFDFA